MALAHMLLQRTPLSIRLATLRARVRSLFGVSNFMNPQNIFVRKRLVTLFTGKRLFSSVNPHVVIQTLLGRDNFVTKCARKGLFQYGVTPHMLPV